MVAVVKRVAIHLALIPVRFVAFMLFYVFAMVAGILLIGLTIGVAVNCGKFSQWFMAVFFESHDPLWQGVGMVIGGAAFIRAIAWPVSHAYEVVRGKVFSKKLKA